MGMTTEAVQLPEDVRDYFVKMGRKGGKKGAAKRTAEQRREAARKAVNARWAKSKKKKEKAA